MARRIRARLVLQLSEAGLSGRRIAATQGVSRNSVREVLAAAREAGIGWREAEAMTDAEVYERLFPGRALSETVYSDPDWERIHRELTRVGVTLKRLHEEYRDEAREGRAAHVLRPLPQALPGVHGEKAGGEPRRAQGGKGARGRLGGADDAARRPRDGRGLQGLPVRGLPALRLPVPRRADLGIRKNLERALLRTALKRDALAPEQPNLLLRSRYGLEG